DKVELFEEIVKEVKVPPTLIASTLEYTLKSLKRERVKIENITNQKIKTIFKYIEQGKIVKEAIPEILKWLAENPDKNIDNALKALGVELIPTEELEKIIDEIINKNIQLIKNRGMKAIGPIMGEVMRKVRGKADGKKVNEIVKNKIKEQLSKK
ncbi:MAG: GatB/YqeY domain-containing protein, partial [archaeon GB-1867-035]|nr:GatB/YqeY domain-containing protein [Candidatus Culexmicrobium profundum]